MGSRVYEFLRKHKDFLYFLIFNLARPFGYLRLPTYSGTFRYALSTARAGYWQARIGKMGKGTRIDSGVIIYGNTRNLTIGDFTHIQDNVLLEVNEPMRIGKYVGIAVNVYMQSVDEVTIGDFVGIGPGAMIMSGVNTYKTPDGREKDILLSLSSDSPQELQYVDMGPVIIEDYALIGMESVVLPGARIGKGAIIGAGSVVTKDIPPYAIAVGTPAMVVGERPIPESERNSTKNENLPYQQSIF